MTTQSSKNERSIRGHSVEMHVQMYRDADNLNILDKSLDSAFYQTSSGSCLCPIAVLDKKGHACANLTCARGVKRNELLTMSLIKLKIEIMGYSLYPRLTPF